MRNLYSLLTKAYHMFMLIKRRKYIEKLKLDGLILGNDVKIIDTFFFDPSHCYLISIGDGCTICPGVRLIAHDASIKQYLGFTKLGRINIGKNCFIGDSVIVLPGVTIGANCIIGAGSVVTGDLPAGSVAVGNPAHIIDSVERYIDKVREYSKGRRVFDKSYSIDRLDKKKLAEILKSTQEEIGFIV